VGEQAAHDGGGEVAGAKEGDFGQRDHDGDELPRPCMARNDISESL
jgi:hypothetical protein